ncbi:histone acetylation protein-domain-containing protein [Rhizoctonia solani]|nr:histone acetylation protein-domain-containing protein [Rhizoctonia solani]
MSITLRDFVASELSKLPGSRTLTLHALVSSPQREQELFPYAQIPKNHKILAQNILLLVSENVDPDIHASTDAPTTPRILCSALEATLYLFPATSSSILYIGKIDTTGFSKVVPSPARTLARATIDYFVRPDTRPAECGQRVWVHLFARAQSQYLFPDSADWKSKRVLNDAGLVRWWWSLFGDVARDVAESRGGQLESRFQGTKMWYILPGFNDIEAYHTLSSGSSFKLTQAGELPWSYGHPYDDPSVSFPLLGKPIDHATADSPHHEDPAKAKSIAYLIPTFPDDPKARFLGEIASTTSEADVPPPAPKPASKPASPTTPTRKLRSVSSSKGSGSSPHSVSNSPSQSPLKKRRRVDVNDFPVNAPNPEISDAPTVTATDENPILNALPATGTSSSDIPSAPHAPAQIKNTTHAEPELVRRGRLALSAVSAKEFWERMGFRQECALGAVTAFFVAVFEESEATQKPDSKIANEYIPLPTHTRIMQSLMNHAFSTPEKAIRSTQLLESSIRTLSDGVVAAVEGTETEDSDSSFYYAHIHKSLTNNNPPLVPRDNVVQPAPVNVLQVKRKARR